MYDCRLYNLLLSFMIFLIWQKCHNIKNNLGVRFTEDGRIDFMQSTYLNMAAKDMILLKMPCYQLWL